MSILFSPVGTADPVTVLGDGPMIHLVRHKLPKLVVLYLSPEMNRHEQADGRYTKAINHLANALQRDAPQVRTIVSEFEEVYRFDHYIDEFERALGGLAAEYPDDLLLVNVSSGTPAMEQALVALGAFGRISSQLLQVLTPRSGVNKKGDREDPDSYDCDSMMELSDLAEAERGYESRIVEVRSPSFYDRVVRENIASLVDNYEYFAAYELAVKSPLTNNRAKEMILATAERLNLDGQRAARLFSGTPLAYRSSDKLAEYLYSMEVRFEQGRWADYLRAMTPALTDVMKQILKRCGLADERYMQMRRGHSTGRFDPEKIRHNARLLQALDMQDLKPCFIKSSDYVRLVDEYCDNHDVVERVHSLRSVEERTRNRLAHEMQKVQKEALEKEGGMTMREIIDALVYLHDWVNPTQTMKLGLYGRISKEIISLL